MNIQVYQSFLTVVQFRSFTQAAKYLNFTQPTISNHITALEEEYGVILFTRDGKNVYLTQAGKNFVPIAKQIMQDYQNSQELMRQFQKDNYSLKIGVSTQGINFYLLPVLLQLKKEFPELDIEVNRCMTVESTIDDAFNKKLYDFAFVHIDVQPLYTPVGWHCGISPWCWWHLRAYTIGCSRMIIFIIIPSLVIPIARFILSI